MRKMRKMPKLKGIVPMLYDREVATNMCLVINAHSDAIDYLAEVIEKQGREIERLKNAIGDK